MYANAVRWGAPAGTGCQTVAKSPQTRPMRPRATAANPYTWMPRFEKALLSSIGRTRSFNLAVSSYRAHAHRHRGQPLPAASLFQMGQ